MMLAWQKATPEWAAMANKGDAFSYFSARMDTRKNNNLAREKLVAKRPLCPT